MTTGLGVCPQCGQSVAITIGEDARSLAVNLDPHPRGDRLVGLDVDVFGDLPEDVEIVRSRLATVDDDPGPRWISHSTICSAQR